MNSHDMFDIIGETPERYVQDAIKSDEKVIPVRKSRKIIWLIAAIIALMLFLMGSAIAILVTMSVEEVKLNVQKDGQYANEGFDIEKPFEGEIVNFDKEYDVFIELGSYYPQELPAGYTMIFVSDGAPWTNQLIRYEDKAGHQIRYRIYVADSASAVEIYRIEKKTDVAINGQPGILYEQEGGIRTLVWVDEKNGFGFELFTEDSSVDLIAMANSTAEGDPLIPTDYEQTKKAIEELGDYSPEYLPAGFEEQGVLGRPISDGGGWYSYVNKWYVNRAENTSIYFEYETYGTAPEGEYTDEAKTISSFFIPEYERQAVGEEIKINGMVGIATDNDIAWADPERHVVYHIHSKDVIGDELLRVAQSITNKH